MQQANVFSYSFSVTGKEKRAKQERKPQPKKRLINYIDTKYIDREKAFKREEMDKDVVF